MMMVVAEMALALHLFQRYLPFSQCVKSFFFVLVCGRSLWQNLPMLAFRLCSAFLLALACGFVCIHQTQAQSESYAERAAHSASNNKHHTPLDINHATFAELMSLPGITEVWAKRIVRFRPYRTKQDLLEHGIVPVRVYNQIHDSVIAHRNSQ